MFSRLSRAAAPFILIAASAAPAQPAPAGVTPDELRPHIEILASDSFEGRLPGTAGEEKTVRYIHEQFARRGLEPAGSDGSWFQAVPLVERRTRNQQVSWSAAGRALRFDQNQIALQGRDAEQRLQGAPVIFAGHGVRLPERGIDHLAGADVNGAVVILLFDAPQVPGFPSFSDRVRAVTEAGAAAVIALTGADLQWEFVTRNYRSPATKLADQEVAGIVGAMPLSAAQALFAQAGTDLEQLLNAQPGSSFRAVALPLRADMQVMTDIRAYETRNVVGRIRGSGGDGETLLFLGHWDHLGICAPDGPDRICNGAVDNASGIAALIEMAGKLASGPRPVRDILFLATTAEEMGLLGAEYFARHPLVPLNRIVAAINLDTIAIHPAGLPAAMLGRGHPALDQAIEAGVVAFGRRFDPDDEAEIMVQRQDGWALARAGVPTVMVGGSISDFDRLGAFLSGPYHKPEDEFGPELELGGAAEDASLLVFLGRRLADPQHYRPLARSSE